MDHPPGTQERAGAASPELQGEARYRRLVEMSPDPIAVHGNGRVLFVNAAAVRALGAGRADELVGRPISDFVDAELMQQVPERVAEMLRSGQPPPVIRGKFRRLDGSVIVGDIASTPTIFDGRAAVQVVIRDTTEQTAAEEALRRAELALRQSEGTLRAVLNGAAIGITQVSAAGELVGVNPAFAEMIGCDLDEAVGLHFRDVTHPDDLVATQELYDRTLATGEHGQIEKRYVRRDGSAFWARLTTSLVTVPDGPSYVVGMVEDITARKAAEEALRESEARFRSLIEHSADMIAILDPDGRALYHSPSSRSMLGYSPEELLGRDVLELVHPDDAPAVRTALAALCASPGGVSSVEFRTRHADGSWRALRSTAENRLGDPAVRGVVVNTRDLTPARELEAQLLQSQKMEAVGRLAGGIAHDFNNILTAVQGHAGILAQDLPADSPHLPDVEQIQRSVERAASLTRQLLAFSRLQVLQPKVLDLNAIVRETERMLGPLIGEDIELRTELAPALGRIKADPAQVQQILLNLAVNARDAMPGGGRLSIRTGNAELDESFVAQFSYPVEPGRYVRLSFSDTGCGIAPEVLDHIFEPFFTTKAPGRGTGLGLSSVYGTVKQSGGYVWVDTEVGRGTTFRIYFPEVEGAAEDAEERRPGPGVAGSGLVLLVEDEPAVRSLALRVLTRAGYVVLSATDGEDALRLCREHEGPIDLVLTDVVMPRLGGGELAARIRALRPGTRVLFMSGYAEDALAHRGVAEGAGFLAKPFSPDMLRHSVADALAGPAPAG